MAMKVQKKKSLLRTHGFYLQSFSAGLLQEFDCPTPRRLLAPALMPGQVPPRAAGEMVLEVLRKGLVLHSRATETETRGS